MKTAAWASPCVAVIASACGAAPVPSGKPQIPDALHGCWQANEAATDESEAYSATLMIRADNISLESTGVPRRTGYIEHVDRMTPQRIEGLISASENNLPVTLATTLEIGTDDLRPGELRLREGDAGSYVFTRCGAPASRESP